MIKNQLIRGLVSVIVPVYNSEKYIRRCIESILNQTYKKIEIILVDDGSTDGSGKICDEYALSDKRIKVIHQKNKGPAAARNAGIEDSKGEFIFFIDADDFIEKDAVNLLIGGYKKSKADLIVGDFKRKKDDEIVKRNDFPISNSKSLDKKEIINYARLYLKRPNKHLLFAYSWGRLFKSLIIKNNNIFLNTKLHTYEDVAFNFDYLNYVNKVYFLKEIVYCHTVRDDRASATMGLGNNPERLFGYKQALVSISNFLRNNSDISDKEIKQEAGHAYITLSIIQSIRTCVNMDDKNKEIITQLIKKLVNELNLRNNLKYYSPSKSDSRILPILMKLKLVWPIIWVCKYKANKRYKKGGVVK